MRWFNRRFAFLENIYKNSIANLFKTVTRPLLVPAFLLKPLDNLRVPFDKAVQIVHLLVEGVGVRATARLASVNCHTVLNVLETVGQKCARLLDQKVRNISFPNVQVDELFAFVGCKERNNETQDSERGDQYVYLERTNLSVRLFNRRFTRLTLGYSKKLANLKHSVALFIAHFNFCRKHSTIAQTPAQSCGLADHQWSIEELLKSEI